MRGEAQPPQVHPALLRPDRAAHPLAHPPGDLRPTPQPSIRARPLQGLRQLRLLLLGQQPTVTRIGLPPVPDAGCPLPIGAVHDLPHPGDRIARLRRDLLARAPLGHQPHDLPLAAAHPLAGLSVVALQFFDAQLPLDAQSLVHSSILHQDLVLQLLGSVSVRTDVANVSRFS